MKMELARFADELNMGWEKKRVRDETSSFGISLNLIGSRYMSPHNSWLCNVREREQTVLGLGLSWNSMDSALS